MIEILIQILYLLRDWSDLLLIIVGLSAFIVYHWQAHDQIRMAATLVKEQIDSIENRVHELEDLTKENGDKKLNAAYYSRAVLNENLWEKYRHILIKKLKISESKTIQKFYDNAEQIESSRRDMRNALISAWEHKSSVMHQIAGTYIKAAVDNAPYGSSEKDPIEMSRLEAFRKTYFPLSFAFAAGIVYSSFEKHLSDYTKLSESESGAYKKLKYWSYDKG